MIAYLITVIMWVGTFYGAYFANLLTGIAKSIYSPKLQFNKKKLVRGAAKWIIVGSAVTILAIVIYVAGWLGAKNGVDWGEVAQYIGKEGLIKVVAVGIGYQIISSISNLAILFGDKKNTKDLNITVDESKADYNAIAEAAKEAVVNLYKLVTPKDYAEKHGEWEEKGGVGRYYSVPHDTFENFMNATIGKGYDIDACHGQQCWDYAALLWQQLGLSLLTGNGLAIGCWDLKRDINSGSQFELIYNVDDLKIGDIVTMRPNHIGFFVGWNGEYMRILGQNQGGTPCAEGGSAVNIVNIAKSTFAGAFRYKAWNKTATTPTITVTANDEPKKSGSGSAAKNNSVTYKYKKGDTFGQVICNLNLKTNHGLWGTNGDVEYYTNQLREQGIYGNIPVGATITLTKRTE